MNKVQTPPPFGGNRARTQEEPLTTDEGANEEPKWVADESGAPLVVGIPGTPGSSIGGFELGNRGGPVSPPIEPLKPGENPFKKKEEVVPEPELIGEGAPEGTPTWGEFVKFVMEHGEHIRRARYPNPPKSRDMRVVVDGPWNFIDTLWHGVPVFNGPGAMIEHDRYGWATWEDCQEK